MKVGLSDNEVTIKTASGAFDGRERALKAFIAGFMTQ